MKYRIEPVILVIVGAWNHAIFNSEWISKYIFDGQEVETKIDAPQNQLRFTRGDITILVVDNRLIIIGSNADKQTLDSIESISFKIADFLPHTPTLAAGINFRLSSSEVEKFKNWFGTDNLHEIPNEILDKGYSLDSTIVKKTFKKDLFTYSISIVKNTQDDILIDVNHEFTIKTLIDIKQQIVSGFYSSNKIEIENHLENLFDQKISA